MKLGAQLYTLRDFTQNERDLDDSLAAVAAMGYTTVQVSGIGPIAPDTVRRLCDSHGLSIALTHTSPDRILHETEQVIAEHEAMGCRYIGIGAMPPRYRDAEWIGHFARDYLPPARKIAAAGMRLMYHNHHFEFAKLGGRRIIDHLLDAFAPQELGFTLDTFWVQAAGGDVRRWIERLRGRIPCVHLKDMAARAASSEWGVMAPVLEGNMDFVGILALLEEQGTTEYLLVEQDTCEESPFVCLKKSYDNLAALGYR